MTGTIIAHLGNEEDRIISLVIYYYYYYFFIAAPLTRTTTQFQVLNLADEEILIVAGPVWRTVDHRIGRIDNSSISDRRSKRRRREEMEL